MFKAVLLTNEGDRVVAGITTLGPEALPEGDVLVRVSYSSLNYKDALAVTGRGKIIRGEYPFVPGIDLAGEVVESSSLKFNPGDRVIATGWGIGEDHWGGYAQFQRLSSDWLVRLPEGLSLFNGMAAGTAGFTAMLSVMALERHGVRPGGGEVVVTGASGGVGSFAVALLARLGYHVVASTGSADAHDFLKTLRAAEIIDRGELGGGAKRPMDKGRWSGAVDTVGGATLEGLISTMDRRASIASSGLAGGHELRTTVFPFILRGVNLLGIDSNTCPSEEREEAWRRLATEVPGRIFDLIADSVPLNAVPEAAERLLSGGVCGRLVVDVNA